MIAEIGEKLLVDIYNGNDGDTLDKLRLVKYHEKVSTGSKQVQLKGLLLQLQPSTTPTESFTRFRSGLVWVPVWNSCLRNGGFSFSGDSYFLFTLTFLQPLRSC